jgi:small subunit ribosomal protein S1
MDQHLENLPEDQASEQGNETLETQPAPIEETETAVEKTTVETTASIKSMLNDSAGAGEEPAHEEEDLDELVLETAQEVVSTAHDDFDWTIGRRNTIEYPQAEFDKYLSIYEATLNSIQELEIVEGRVSSVGSHDVMLDLNYKSDGIVPLSEFRDRPGLLPGETVEVYVENREDRRGQMVLSRRKAKLLRAWDNIVNSFKEGRVLNGTVISKTKGGLIVDIDGLETFLPGSQIDIKPILDYDVYVGKQMEFKVVKINETIKNAVVSHKALIESDLEQQRSEIISKLEQGQVLEGTVKNITDFGAFLDLGGVDGLLYITDISWGRVKHPSDVLQLNQKINVVVLDFDDEKRRISLGLKQLQPHPWKVLPEDIVQGSVVKGRIVNIEDYGAFLEIMPGVEGLIHVSEVSWSNQPINAREFFKINSEIDAKVVTIDREERKMSLSIKQLTPDPWTTIENKFPRNSRHNGLVKNLTPYGVFVELEDGIGGMIHISDLSWTKRYSHPSEFTKIGQRLDVVILDIDPISRKLSLGHKQLEENPWDTFENVFPVGSYHEATVVRVDDRGALVQLPYGLEAFAPARHIRKEDNSVAKVEEVLMFKVLEFSRDDKRILVSHTRYLEDIRKEAVDEQKRDKDKTRTQEREDVKKVQGKVERATLGELNVFSQLREQMNAPEEGAPASEEQKDSEE